MAARRSVSWPRLLKMALFGPKSAVFWPEIYLLWTASIFFATIMTGHQKDNIFVLIMLLDKLLGGYKGRFLARKSAYGHKRAIYGHFEPF